MTRSDDCFVNVCLMTEEMGSGSMLNVKRKPTFAGRMKGAFVGAVCLLGMMATPSLADDTRTLDLYNAHTKERLTITFKKNGRYIPSALTELNQFLRDWRRNESIRMDPRLFDAVWDVYRKSGATQPIHVVCGYRSLATNDMLRSRSSGVAKHSQHTLGKAMDLFIPGVSVNRVREIGVSLQHGGVGWYPNANSPFVHIDVGNVRAWPKMTRSQLVRIFPDGKTLHVPSDGKPLPGYQQALAEMKKSGSVSSAAYAESDTGSVKKGGLLAMLFGDEEDGNAEVSASADDEGGAPAVTAKAAKAAKAPAPVAVAAAVPKPAPEAPASSLANATLPGVSADSAKPAPAVTEVAELPPAPKPRSKPDVPVAAEPAMVAEAAPVVMPRSKPEAPVDAPIVVAAAEPVAPIPAPAPAVVVSPAALADPADAQMALAEVAKDRLTTTDSTTALGYASATEMPAPASARKPLIQTASLTGAPIIRSLGGRNDSLSALPAVKDEASDPLASLKSAPLANNLPIFDGGQSAYWGVFATMVHPDQRNISAMMVEPVKVVVSGFGAKPYEGTLTSVRFTGTALPRLQVMHFDPSNDLAMR